LFLVLRGCASEIRIFVGRISGGAGLKWGLVCGARRSAKGGLKKSALLRHALIRQFSLPLLSFVDIE